MELDDRVFNIVGLVGIVASVAYGAAFFLYTLLGLYSLDVLGINFGDWCTSWWRPSCCS